MSTRLEQLQASAVAEARLQDALTRAFARDLEQALILLTRQIRQLLKEMATAGGQLVGTQANLGRALALRRDLQVALRESGVIALTEAALDAPLDRLAEHVLGSFSIAGRAAQLTPFDVASIAAWKDLRLAQLLQIHEDTVAAVMRTVLDGVLSARPMLDLLDDLEDVLDLSHAEARTVYDTAISMFSRQVEQLHTTGAPDELFVYVGPADVKTRPFCRRYVGTVQDRKTIDGLDNGQLPNPLITGGGYNCRHKWKRVSVLDDELIALHASKGRQAYIAQQLQEVPA